VVDAENERVFAWYRDQGFLGTGVDNRRLDMKVSTARKYLNP
jgi:ribosomal protein S18 acetylase RimI-like enzyme